MGERRYNSSIMALDGGKWSASRPGRFTPGERDLDTHCIGGWVGPHNTKISTFQSVCPLIFRMQQPEKFAKVFTKFNIGDFH
jgi:hypothetical protein